MKKVDLQYIEGHLSSFAEVCRNRKTKYSINSPAKCCWCLSRVGISKTLICKQLLLIKVKLSNPILPSALDKHVVSTSIVVAACACNLLLRKFHKNFHNVFFVQPVFNLLRGGLTCYFHDVVIIWFQILFDSFSTTSV
jgi:hypothetical protein